MSLMQYCSDPGDQDFVFGLFLEPARSFGAFSVYSFQLSQNHTSALPMKGLKESEDGKESGSFG